MVSNNVGVRCGNLRPRGSSLKLCFNQFFIQEFILGSLWLLAGFHFEYDVGSGGKLKPRSLMSVDDRFEG